MNLLRCPFVFVVALVGGTLLAQSDGVRWIREDYMSMGAKPPVQAPDGNSRLTAEVTGGVFRLVDSGSDPGDLLTCERPWCADPSAGASCRASVKVVRSSGLAGVMIGFSDGVHEDLLTLYPDRIELYRAQQAFVMDTTDDFHAYQVDIHGTDVTVSVDSRPVIRAPGAFAFPAHQGRNRFSFGSGASASQGESQWQWVAWTDGAEALRKRWPVISTAEQITVFKQAGGFMVRSGLGDSGDVWVATTRDGRTAEVVRVMGDPEDKLRFTEETLAHETSDGVLWLLTRVEGGDDHLWQAVSRDGGRTWSAAKSPIRGHPPSGLVRLADGRLVLTYGFRHPPYGIRAVVSRDEGLTWDTDHLVVLRNDGAGYDLGYPISMVLPDQTIVTMYYFVLPADGISHIACTRWRCDAPDPP
jgi:hypothetical protein